jgi:hypothetical protein
MHKVMHTTPPVVRNLQKKEATFEPLNRLNQTEATENDFQWPQ